MIINKEYIISKINALIAEKQKNNAERTKQNNKLWKLKQLFPLWLRKLLFSPFNPVYAIYKENKNSKVLKNTIKFDSLDPLAVDFVKYCFENDINFDTSIYSANSQKTIIDFIDNRLKSILSGYVSMPMNELQIKYFKCQQKFKNNRKKGQFFILSLEGKKYYLPQNIFHPYVFDLHYGLKALPDSVKEYIIGKDFLDIGAFIGDTCLILSEYKPNKIFAFEPVSSTFNNLQLTINKNGLENDIIAIKKGIGESVENMSISIQGGASSLIYSGASETENIEITTIDSESEGKTIGLIKMDIEGFEYYAIKGGINTIKKDKPVLLISIYHTGRDFFEIPPLLKSICPEYKMSIVDIEPTNAIAEKILIAYI